jgi:hypothetical protein
MYIRKIRKISRGGVSKVVGYHIELTIDEALDKPIGTNRDMRIMIDKLHNNQLKDNNGISVEAVQSGERPCDINI